MELLELARHKPLLKRLAVFIVLLAPSAPLQSDVELIPGKIEGNIRIGSEEILGVRVRAENAEDSAEQYLYPNVVTVPYSLTVNVPAGTNPTYNVRAQQIQTSDAGDTTNTDYFWFPIAEVDAIESDTVEQNFVLENPGYVSGTVTLNGDGELDRIDLYASPKSTSGYVHWTRHYTNSAERNLLEYEFPVSPGEHNCSGTAYLISGARITLPSKSINVTEGSTATCDYEIDTPETGQISGTIGFSGEEEPHQFRVYTYSPTNTSWTGNDPNNPEEYELTDLSIGNYTIYAESRLNNYDDVFYYPNNAFSPSRSTTIETGDVDIIDIGACQAYLNGVLSLKGSATLDDFSSGQKRVYGTSATTLGGSGYDSMDSGTGEYDLVLSPGDWRSNYFYLRFSRPDTHEDGYLNTWFYLYDQAVMTSENPANLADCGSTTTRDFEYRFGQVTVNFSIVGGGTMSSPQLRYGQCIETDAESGDTLYTYSNLRAYSNQTDVELGSVTFLVPQGSCTDIEALANVGGSLTSFGEFDVEVVGGSDVIIDIGGPSVAVQSPEAEACLSGDNVTVTGTATDDVGVTSVTVNGEFASLDPAGGEGTTSTAFSATISLEAGPNEIETIATDTSDKTGSDTRTVYKDAGPPVLNWTPADDTVTSSTSIEVSGTVSDDVDVESVTVNGNAVLLTPTGTPGEYTFLTDVDLVDGENKITVVAMDTSNCADPTTEIRNVILSDNTGPTVDEVRLPLEPIAAGDTTQAMCLFTDPDTGDTHTVGWDWGDGYSDTGTVDNRTASGSHTYDNAGLHTVGCTITDAAGENDSGEATRDLVVYDPSAGFVTGGGWFNSPEGAAPDYPTLRDKKINFGIVSKYKKGATAPMGSVEFNAKRFNFKSKSLDWMVIGSNWAWIAGTGTIGRTGDYQFILTVMDTGKSRDRDAVRMKIWDEADPDNPIYDNQPGEQEDAEAATDLGGGAIVIHSR